MKFYSYISAALLVAGVTFTSCNDSETVDNRVMDISAIKPSSVLIDGMADSSTQRFNLTMVNPVNEKVSVVYGVDESLVEAYNAIFNESAIMLPKDNYNLVESVAVFAPGGVTSSDVVVDITNLNTLDRNIVYVLPIAVKSSTVPVLESQKVRYIVVRGAALINVVCDIIENNGSLIKPRAASGLNNLTQMTFQCIFNVEEWGGKDANIQSIAGIEGSWLLRISDSGLPANQLQFVTPSGNLTDASWQFNDKQWVCMTFTWDAPNSAATLFIDGVKKATVTGRTQEGVSWGNDEFYIGKSYNDNRWLNGTISEVRVWNRILSDAEIAEPLQPYAVATDAEGLVSHWKFNEGSGSMIHDYANGYDIMLATTPTWVTVSLPK